MRWIILFVLLTMASGIWAADEIAPNTEPAAACSAAVPASPDTAAVPETPSPAPAAPVESHAVPAAAAVVPAQPVSEELMNLLAHLEERCWTMRTFQAKMVYEKVQALIDTKTIQHGRQYYEVKPDESRQNPETVRFLMHFTDLQEIDLEQDEAYPLIKFDEHYYFDGRWVVRRNSRTKSIERWEMSKEPATRETFRLGQGPIPLPFALRREDALREFDASLIADEDAAKAKLAHLHLVPKPAGSFAEQYAALDLWIDTTTYLVQRLQFEAKDSEITRVAWSEIEIDKLLASDIFVLQPGGDGWTETVHPYEESQEKSDTATP